MDQQAVGRNVEHADAALDELGLNAELRRNLRRQTGGPGEVASTGAVLDGDAHDPVPVREGAMILYGPC
jgi:hypothetical protein